MPKTGTLREGGPSSSEGKEGAPPQDYRRVWAFSFGGWISLYMTRMIFTPALPSVIEEFGISYTQAGTLASAVFWAYAPMMLISGYLGDRLGRKLMIALGFFLWSLLCLLTPLAFSLGSLFFFRFLTGFVQGTYFGNDRAVLTAFTPPERWGAAQGLTMMGTGLGNFLALFLGGLMVGTWGWRWMFWVVGAVSLAAALIYARFAPSPGRFAVEETPGETFPGRGLFSGTLILLYGIGFVIMNVFWVFGIWIPLIFIDLGARDPMTASLYGSVYALGGIPGMAAFGYLTDLFRKKWGVPRRTVMVFSLAAATSILLLAALSYRPDMDFVLFCGLVGTLGFFITGLWPPLYAMIAEASPPKALGTVFGLSNSIAFLGAVLAPILTGLLKDWTQSFLWGFYAAAAAMGAAAILSLKIPFRSSPGNPPTAGDHPPKAGL